jgi:hypothetical protein
MVSAARWASPILTKFAGAVKRSGVFGETLKNQPNFSPQSEPRRSKELTLSEYTVRKGFGSLQSNPTSKKGRPAKSGP